MDRTKLTDKWKGAGGGKSLVGKALTLTAVAGIGLGVGLAVGKRPAGMDTAGKLGDHSASHSSAHGASGGQAGAQGWWSRLFGTYVEAFRSVQDKVEEVRRLDTENERLRLENAHLRLQIEGAQFGHRAKEASEKTQAIELKLDHETGSAVGRDLASIQYKPPTNLLPNQLYTLGVSYFKGREDEKAAVILTFLTGLEKDETFKTARNYVMAGVAWYRLENYPMADRYFDRALRTRETPDSLALHAQARLWKALAAQRLGKHAKAQFWLTDLLDHHPRSVEVEWVNPQTGRTEAHREPSSHP